MPNYLAEENSPYLLQHASNPVDWHPWGEQALARAKQENKPIFLSIGYAACHWCHVMAHESFEDELTASILNENFVCVKVDREERPDLDAIYMRATVALSGSGGWPMSVFLTPDLRPFYAGTYFPPARRYNLPGFPELLRALAQAWGTRQQEIHAVAARVDQSLSTPDLPSHLGVVSQQLLEQAESWLVRHADRQHGGWGAAPKFPQPMAIELLLLQAAADPGAHADGLAVATQSLQAMARGGMYDVLGGGFSRYSTDTTWHVPHFEKMLYDNAQLALAYLHAFLVTGETSFRQVAAETLDFVAGEMAHPEGGFYSSLDADSEGREGKYYVWTQAEIREVIGDPSLTELFLAAYDVGTAPASQGGLVLQRAPNDANLSARFDKSASEIEELLQRARARLFRARQARPRPGLDDKVILAWNGLMLQAFAQAARFFGEVGSGAGGVYLEVATRNAAFLLGNLRSHGQLHRIWRRGKTGQHVFLEDYAALILGLLDLYQADFSNAWFIAARQLADEMLLRFSAPEGGFFDTPDDSKPPLIRPMELQDGATPAGGALATEALLKLAALTGEATYRDHAERTLPLGLANAAESPLSYARWLAAAALALAGPRQLALLFPPSANPAAFLGVVNSAFRPHWMVAASPYPPPTGAPPLLQDRPVVANLPTAFVCRDFACLRPITDPAELPALL